MVIAEVIELSPISTKSIVKNGIDPVKRSYDDLVALNRLWDRGPLNRYDERAMVFRQEIEHKYTQDRVAAFNEAGGLPENYLPGNDTLSILAKSPTVQTAELRKIADALGFAIFSAEYLRDQRQEDYATQRAIAKFRDDVGKIMDAYVLGPVAYYDVSKHINHEGDDKPLWGGKDIAQALMAIDMTVPSFRAIKAELDDHTEQLRDYGNRVARVEQDIASLARRLNDMQQRVEQMKADQIRRENERVKEITEMDRSTKLISYDPLMFAIPSGKSINDDLTAVVGPFWGPDFKDIVLTALGFRKVDGQRQILTKKCFNVWANR